MVAIGFIEDPQNAHCMPCIGVVRLTGAWLELQSAGHVSIHFVGDPIYKIYKWINMDELAMGINIDYMDELSWVTTNYGY